MEYVLMLCEVCRLAWLAKSTECVYTIWPTEWYSFVIHILETNCCVFRSGQGFSQWVVCVWLHWQIPVVIIHERAHRSKICFECGQATVVVCVVVIRHSFSLKCSHTLYTCRCAVNILFAKQFIASFLSWYRCDLFKPLALSVWDDGVHAVPAFEGRDLKLPILITLSTQVWKCWCCG